MQSTHATTIYAEPEAYDLLPCRPEDIPFYLQMLERYKGSVLELGVGTGRVAIPLAERGYSVTGIDIDEGMLALGRKKAEAAGVNIEWTRGDVRNFDMGRKFDGVLYPINSISHMLDLQSIGACLSRVREHLSDNGRFIFQVFNPLLHVFLRDPEQRYPVAEYDDPFGRGPVVVTENNIYDRANQLNCIKWHYTYQETGEEVVRDLTMRIFYPQELDALLRYNGLEIEHKYGSYDLTPFTSDSPLQLPVCRRL
jgi:SAM-dependent methyltransferase